VSVIGVILQVTELTRCNKPIPRKDTKNDEEQRKRFAFKKSSDFIPCMVNITIHYRNILSETVSSPFPTALI